MRTLSTGLTAFLKFAGTPLGITAFGAVGIWFVSLGLGLGSDTLARVEISLGISAFWSLRAVTFWRSYGGIKRVRVDDQSLYVSNYLKEIVIPLNTIASVAERRWSILGGNGPCLFSSIPIIVQFRSPTEFGRNIHFMPTVRLFAPWKYHPTVDELRGLAGIPDTRS